MEEKRKNETYMWEKYAKSSYFYIIHMVMIKSRTKFLSVIEVT